MGRLTRKTGLPRGLDASRPRLAGARSRPQPGRVGASGLASPRASSPRPHPPRRVGLLRPFRAVERPAEHGADGRHSADREHGKRGPGRGGARPVTGLVRSPGSGLARDRVPPFLRGERLPRSGMSDATGVGASRGHLPSARALGNEGASQGPLEVSLARGRGERYLGEGPSRQGSPTGDALPGRALKLEWGVQRSGCGRARGLGH